MEKENAVNPIGKEVQSSRKSFDRYVLSRWNFIARSMWARRSQKQKWVHYYVLYPALSSIIKRLGFRTVLDYGCGDGEFIRFCFDRENITDCFLFAYDCAEEMKRLARARLPDGILLSSDLGNRKFDGIVMNMVLQGVFNIDQLLKKVTRHLRSQGRLILSIPNPKAINTVIPNMTVSHEVFDDGHMDGVVKERTYWTNDKTSWTIQFHRSKQKYLEAFFHAGLEIESCQFPKPIDEGRVDEELFHFHSTNDDVVIFILRRTP